MRRSLEARLDSGKYLPDSQCPEYVWEAHEHLVARDGDGISPKEGEHWVCCYGHVTVRDQTGGYWQAGGSSRQTVSGHKDGIWDAWDSSRQTISGQKDGQWSAWDSSRQTISGQKGGKWYAYDNSRQTVSGQKGGHWGAKDISR